MRPVKSWGQELIEAVKEAIEQPETVRTLTPRFQVKQLRQQLALTQKQFAQTYHLKLETLKNWEQGEKAPDNTGIAYLTCIAKAPKTIKQLLQH